MKTIIEPVTFYVSDNGTKFMTEEECLRFERADSIGVLAQTLEIDVMHKNLVEARRELYEKKQEAKNLTTDLAAARATITKGAEHIRKLQHDLTLSQRRSGEPKVDYKKTLEHMEHKHNTLLNHIQMLEARIIELDKRGLTADKEAFRYKRKFEIYNNFYNKAKDEIKRCETSLTQMAHLCAGQIHALHCARLEDDRINEMVEDMSDKLDKYKSLAKDKGPLANEDGA